MTDTNWKKDLEETLEILERFGRKTIKISDVRYYISKDKEPKRCNFRTDHDFSGPYYCPKMKPCELHGREEISNHA